MGEKFFTPTFSRAIYRSDGFAHYPNSLLTHHRNKIQGCMGEKFFTPTFSRAIYRSDGFAHYPNSLLTHNPCR
jgi:hypothetical protein